MCSPGTWSTASPRCVIFYHAPDRIAVAGALVPDTDEDVIAQLAAGQVEVGFEPQTPAEFAMLTRLVVHRPLPSEPATAPPPVRQAWS